jgi:Na+-driven multidrug efflux pump
MMLTIVSLWVLQFPLAYVLSKHTSLGAEGVFWSTPVANVVVTAITACIYLHGGWRKKRILDDEEVLTEKVSEEILSGEGSRQ